jgi:hypothetical protein
VTRETQPTLLDELLSGSATVETPPTPTKNSTDRSNDSFFTGREASEYLWKRYRIQRSERRLAQLRAAPVGAGPPYFRDGAVPRYRRGSLDTWALMQLGREHGSTSDEAAFHQQQRTTAA